VKIIKSNFFLALLSGVLLSISWPETGFFVGFIFVALVPLLWVEYKLSSNKAPMYQFTVCAFVTFFVFNLLSLRWLFLVSEPLSVKWVSILFPSVANGIFMSICVSLASYVVRHVGRKEGIVGFIIFWIGFEYLHFNWELHFPWLSLGNVFANHPSIVKWYSVTGVLGGTLWIWIINLLLIHAVIHRKSIKKSFYLALALFFVGPFIWSWSISVPEKSGVLDVGVVQPNYDPYEAKFYTDPLLQVEEMLALSNEVSSAKWVVWPETALHENSVVHPSISGPLLYGLWENQLDESQSFRLIKQWQNDSIKKPLLLTGMSSRSWITDSTEVAFHSRRLSAHNAWFNNYNSAILFDDTISMYHKNKLVAGVETFPYASLLSPLEGLILNMGGTSGSLGRSAMPVVMGDEGEKVAPIICYESVFGEYVGMFVRKGANWIAIITNDGWWGNGAGYKQHLAYAKLLAISHQRWVIRSANTGISGFINPHGEIVKASSWWKKEAIQLEIDLYDHQTFYTKHGDYLGRSAAFFTVLLYALAFVRKRKNKALG
jgi:apolipoprotein N-acyltransferase